MNFSNVARTNDSIARRRDSRSGSINAFKAFRSRLSTDSLLLYCYALSQPLIAKSIVPNASFLSIKGTILPAGNGHSTAKQANIQQ
jgi:hypothetical protein